MRHRIKQALHLLRRNERHLTLDNCTFADPNAVAAAVAIAGAGVTETYDEYDFQNVFSEIGSSAIATTSAGYVPTFSEIEDYQREVGIDSSSEDDDEDDVVALRIKIGDLKIPSYAAALDRGKVSDRFGGLLATCLLKDLKISCIIDRNKIRRVRKLTRKEAIAAHKSNDLLKCLFFDGKKDQTLVQKAIEGTGMLRNELKLEEHITMVKEPESKFVGFVTIPDGTGESIKEGILNYLTEADFSLDHLVAVGCDGTPTNTGVQRGAVKFMEDQLGRPLQRLLCLFHFNELPLRKLFNQIGGFSTGPTSYGGPIARELHIAATIMVNIN